MLGGGTSPYCPKSLGWLVDQAPDPGREAGVVQGTVLSPA